MLSGLGEFGSHVENRLFFRNDTPWGESLAFRVLVLFRKGELGRAGWMVEGKLGLSGGLRLVEMTDGT